VSADGRHVYVTVQAGLNRSRLQVFARDPGSGALTHLSGRRWCFARFGRGGCTPARGLATPGRMTVSPDGRSLYVASSSLSARFGDVAVFRVDPASRRLRQLAGRAGCVGANMPTCRRAPGVRGAQALSLSRDGRHAYVLSFIVARRGEPASEGGTLTVLARDRTSGALRPLRGRGACVGSVLRMCERLRGAGTPRDVVVAPDGRHVYMTSGVAPPRRLGGIAVLARNPRTGLLQ